ncbi:hypothetical protein SAMN05216223_118142 [Actinacidiphila yanglinensis]|uniref:Uncharacterized protein n=1 Tax=Actinacidiphila yanglinensis TaxID=310779 RepID=A0A1H6DQV0_9ACTN|nr:hypothetical protein [Actinacidiphila yanglinensis]SEG87679.1 hypothetical protein SAMN05216223_118142 [Actinacidiphila yanglinensis]
MRPTLVEVKDMHDALRLAVLALAAAALAALARGTRRGNEDNLASVTILFGALPVHESAGELWQEGTAVHRRALHDVAEHLSRSGALRPDLDVERCTDLLRMCFGVGAWRTLVQECGLTWDAAERQLAAMARGTLLHP